MYKALLISYMLTAAFVGFGQNAFVKQWDYRYGGNNADELTSIIQVPGNGFLIIGVSKSDINGDKTQANRDTTLEYDDYWIVRIDENGNKLWDKRYGGEYQDLLYAVCLTGDGGFLLGGESYSNADGDKSQPGRGGFDYWVIKIDSIGNKQWDKTFGTLYSEDLQAVKETPDKGFILAGSTSCFSINGDKSQIGRGADDFWIVKIDSVGNKLWDKVFGSPTWDGLSDIALTTDGGFLLGGFSLCDSAGGDKSSPNWSDDYDFWVIKVDSLGNKLWDKIYGGFSTETISSVKSTADGGFILFGNSYSGIGGDKSQPVVGNSEDYWLVKIDSVGNKQWDRNYGGTDEENAVSVVVTNDNGYLISGRTISNLGGDISEDNTAYLLPWLVKTDSLGFKQWDKTIFANTRAYGQGAIQTSDGCYISIATCADGPGGYKSQPPWGISLDYWILKFCMEPLGIEEVTIHAQVNVYPNPFAQDISITLQKEHPQQARFTITNSIGQIIYSRTETNISNSYTKNLDLSNLPNGIYFIEVNVDSEKIVKQVVKE